MFIADATLNLIGRESAGTVTRMQKDANIVSMKFIITNSSSNKFVFSGHFWEYSREL